MRIRGVGGGGQRAAPVPVRRSRRPRWNSGRGGPSSAPHGTARHGWQTRSGVKTDPAVTDGSIAAIPETTARTSVSVLRPCSSSQRSRARSSSRLPACGRVSRLSPRTWPDVLAGDGLPKPRVLGQRQPPYHLADDVHQLGGGGDDDVRVVAERGSRCPELPQKLHVADEVRARRLGHQADRFRFPLGGEILVCLIPSARLIPARFSPPLCRSIPSAKSSAAIFSFSAWTTLFVASCASLAADHP